MKLILTFIAVAAMACCCSAPDRQVYCNAKVYTADQARAEATAFDVQGDKIAFAGKPVFSTGIQ